jgi:hypothetical protein
VAIIFCRGSGVKNHKKSRFLEGFKNYLNNHNLDEVVSGLDRSRGFDNHEKKFVDVEELI